MKQRRQTSLSKPWLRTLHRQPQRRNPERMPDRSMRLVKSRSSIEKWSLSANILMSTTTLLECARIAIIQKVGTRWLSYVSTKIAGSTLEVFARLAIWGTTTVAWETIMQRLKRISNSKLRQLLLPQKVGNSKFLQLVNRRGQKCQSAITKPLTRKDKERQIFKWSKASQQWLNLWQKT